MSSLQLIEGFWEDNKIAELRQEIGNVISSIDLSASRSIFTTNNNMEGDIYMYIQYVILFDRMDADFVYL